MRPVDRHLIGGALALAMLAGLGPAGITAVSAQGLVPANYFNQAIDPSSPTGVEADELIFDANNNTITAYGDVVLKADGWVLKGQSLVFRRNVGELEMSGGVTVRDPAGNISQSPSLVVTGGMRQVFLQSLALTGTDGSLVTADSLDYDRELQSVLVNAYYAPCGDCIDDKGRRIGWSMSAAKVTYNREDRSVTLEQPSLALLGVPVLWLPYLWLPDLSGEALDDMPRPELDYDDKYGLKVSVPVTVYSSRFTDVILSPTLLTGQGGLLGAEWIQRFSGGQFRIKASGLYQFNKNAFSSYGPAVRDWRGAIQASGHFVPVKDWEVGASYAVYTDRAYFDDYDLDKQKAAINQVYVTHLNDDTYLDARVQQFNALGNTSQAQVERQGLALPNVRVEKTFTLPEGAGQVDIEARLLGVQRVRDSASTVGGVPYVHGYAGSRMHGMAQASWQNQFIAGGAVVTPFLGARLDGAVYDGNSTLASAPPAGDLWGVTPIAALDVRYPLIAGSPGMTHLVEPIAQIVYRNASSIAPGITNEDSQSVVFDDTNLFSYNRFTGIDRQETGLRLNVGGRYLASMDDGNYLELVAGQSFQLAGTNVFATPDLTNAGVDSGLDSAASYAVLGAYGRVMDSVSLGGKLQVDTTTFALARAGAGIKYSQDGWAGAFNYRYAKAETGLGNVRDLHEVGVEATMPFADYWSVSSNVYWDLAANKFLQVGGGLAYDDGYLNIAGAVTRTGPTHTSPNDTRITATFRIKAPSGLNLGYSGGLPGL
ncbi:MAG: LPS-assembly protein LptD [Devosia sp.]|uniref:LPS-assembly protein LptD n=1 Tax=Devosia sp. TaxID=1871048 RepID=UPI0024CAF3F4|nr:LPS assembly protein LptD [Devosia sp.]UYN98334.1 MAG: LPS-assembly protein LptD [Devosia sp.]